MQFDLMHIWAEMDWMAKTVTITLFLMGFASLTIFIDRTIAYFRSKRQSRQLAEQAATLINASQYEQLVETSRKYPASHLGRVLSAALSTYAVNRPKLSEHAEVIEMVRREIARQQESASIDLRRGLNLLASVGSVAPFVGLLGTVVGIIAAFRNISESGSGGLATVAGGISEALVVTALGLLIAIPAVLLFNRLSGQADGLQHRLSTSSSQLLDHLEFVGPREASPAVPRGA